MELDLVHPNAAGIDIGDSVHAVAVPAGRDVDSIRTFGTFTSDLEGIVQWLRECRIDTVAMESTGVYWKIYSASWFKMDLKSTWSMRSTRAMLLAERQMKVMHSGSNGCIAVAYLQVVFCLMIR